MSQELLTKKQGQYFFAVGRRKSAVARVRFYPVEPFSFIINDRPLEKYFSTPQGQLIVLSPLELLQKRKNGRFTVKVEGGGLSAQAESIRHGLARVLVKSDSALRPTLKKAGYLRRDARVKERKKPGLKKARRAPQWQKR